MFHCWSLRMLLHFFVVDGEPSRTAAARSEPSYINIINRAGRAIKVNGIYVHHSWYNI